MTSFDHSINISGAGFSLPGSAATCYVAGGEPPSCQDDFYFSQSESSALAIVADGHGARGKSIAQELTKRTSSITDHGQNFAILAHDMLQNAHRFFCQDSSMTVGSGNEESGSTATAVALNRIGTKDSCLASLAFVGDSLALAFCLASEEPYSVKSRIELTKAHRNIDTNALTACIGPSFLSVPSGCTSANMPLVIEQCAIELAAPFVIIVATDGLWDFVDTNVVEKVINACCSDGTLTAKNLVNSLLDAVEDTAATNDTPLDDCTIVVLLALV